MKTCQLMGLAVSLTRQNNKGFVDLVSPRTRQIPPTVSFNPLYLSSDGTEAHTPVGPGTSDQNGATILEQIPVTCAPGTVLQRFHLWRSGTWGVFWRNVCSTSLPGGNLACTNRFHFTCCHSQDVTLDCSQEETNWNFGGDGKLYYLDRQNVKCPDHKAMSSFRMLASGINYKFIYSCCNLIPTT